jgi:hypothetical protein
MRVPRSRLSRRPALRCVTGAFLTGATVILLQCALILCARGAAASPFDPKGEDWEGLSELVRTAQRELGAERAVVTTTLDLQELKREDGLLIIHPTRTLDAEELAAYMHSGGRLAILDDYGAGDSLVAHFGIRRVPLPARPAEMIRGNPSFAIAEPASAHPAIRDVTRVVTNHATGLAQAALSPVLVVRASREDGNNEPDVLLGIAGAVGQGRLLAIGDGSLVINSMLRYPGNRALATSLVRYLVEDDVWGKRSGKLYILVNEFETTGSFGDDSRTAGFFADMRRGIVDALETLRHEGMPPGLAYAVAIVVGLGVVVWASVRAGRTHRASTPRFTRRVPVASQGGVAGHAAIIGAPGTSRVLAMLEIKSALEENLATKLGLDRAPPHDVLVRRMREARLLDAEQLGALERLLASLTKIETMLLMRRRGALERVRDADVVAVAHRAHEILDAAGRATS